MTIRLENPTKATTGGAATDHSTLANLTSATAGHTGYQATIISSNVIGTANQVLVTGGTGAILKATTFSLPQSIGTASTVQFLGITGTSTGQFSNVLAGASIFTDITTTIVHATTLEATGTVYATSIDGYPSGTDSYFPQAIISSGGFVGIISGSQVQSLATITSASGYIPRVNIGARHLRFSIVDPTTAYAATPALCIWASVDTAIYITGLRVDCNIDPTTELTGDLKTADAWVGTANPVIISGFDTASGVTSLTNLTASIAATKCLYIQFDTAAQTTVKNIAFDITYIYT
jgi:hypothetical protein